MSDLVISISNGKARVCLGDSWSDVELTEAESVALAQIAGRGALAVASGIVGRDATPRTGTPGKCRFDQVRTLCATHGYVTSVMLAQVSGRHRTDCNWYLHSAKRQGKVRFLGKGRFAIAEDQETEVAR